MYYQISVQQLHNYISRSDSTKLITLKSFLVILETKNAGHI